MGLVRYGGETFRCELAAGDAPGHCSWCGVVLPPRRTRWCSKDCARAFGDNHYWTNARRAAMERAGFRCAYGCDTLDLHVHHRIPVAGAGYGRGCQHHQANLLLLCASHHRDEHRFLRQVATLVEWADGVVSEQLRLPIAV